MACCNTFKAQAMEESISKGLFIRKNCTKALKAIDIKPSENDGSYAFKATLTRCIIGLLNSTTKKEKPSNRIAVKR